MFRSISNNPDCTQGVIALDSKSNKKRINRYNITFNLLILIIVLLFFLLFFKVYNDYKDSQINDFINYGIEQTAIVAKELESKLQNTLTEIHSSEEKFTFKDIQGKHFQIENA